MKLVALTGGIASGKSTIARRLSELGAAHVDADLLAREAVAPGSRGLASIRERFGDEMIAANGDLDRRRLGERVFADAEALAELNAIVHPEVRRLAEHRIARIVERDPGAVVIYDVPLLVEAGLEVGPGGRPWDLVVVAEAPVETRVRRLVELRGMSEAEARSRIANQAGDAERRGVADVVIETGGTERQTLEQVDALWHGVLGIG